MNLLVVVNPNSHGCKGFPFSILFDVKYRQLDRGKEGGKLDEIDCEIVRIWILSVES